MDIEKFYRRRIKVLSGALLLGSFVCAQQLWSIHKEQKNEYYLLVASGNPQITESVGTIERVIQTSSGTLVRLDNKSIIGFSKQILGLPIGAKVRSIAASTVNKTLGEDRDVFCVHGRKVECFFGRGRFD